ncbi:hypothetical protein BDW74DRAFT_165279 [Aspergillus multicolor]|uniref:ATP-binding mismatch repair protein PMS1 n=1 Tax=Aspergillus multicolor TaxID=41759 RepID=UPI003CCE4CD8
MGALLSLPLLALPSAGTVLTAVGSCCGAATCSAVCSACGKFNNSMATRIAYAFILLINSIVSWIMLTPWALKKLQHLTLDYMEIKCDGKECYGWVAVHRINFGLGLFHLVLAVFLLGVRSSKDNRAALQNGFWGPKIVLWLLFVVMSFFIPESFFFVYGHYIAFFCAMLFLLLGLILLVDLAHTWAELCLQRIEDHDSRMWRGLLIGSTMGMFIASIAMTVLMYVFFAKSGCSMNQAAISINLVVFLIVSFISVQPAVQENNPRAGLAQAAMVTAYCTYLTLSAVSMEPDDRQCNPLIRARGTRTATIVLGAIVTMATIAYTTTRAATQGFALGSKGHNYIELGADDNEHGLVIQQPSTRREMRAEALRAAVASGSLPASALDESDDEDEYDVKDDEKGSTQYNYSLFHIIFFLATTWVATLLTQNLDPESVDDFAPVGRTYWASWVKIISAWVHQIQSGQVIVDLNSVIKELVENSLDASATSIEVRFRNNGLDLIEVQDNGSGIAPENYDNVALKHYTSKLSSYDDLLRLQTFGFRGEALSSLCALSEFRITTAQANQAPRATRLEFEQSGKLKKTQVVAGQKGTTASVEGLFKKLPVRRRELEKNIKREYGKVLNLLHAYACISTGVRFSVKNTQAKKTAVVFTTNGNQTTKENIANVYGAKTLLALIPLDLELEFEPSRRMVGVSDKDMNRIQVRGHISRPVFGEGRQTPDRQMFFVNSRPCALPQIAKAFNEVYKSFNVAQSPFVFADFHMDTNAYDVNVSPDKRTILLHDAGALIESLKENLQTMFESADQTVPQSQVLGKLPLARQRSLPETTRVVRATEQESSDGEEGDEKRANQTNPQERMKSLLGDIKARDSQLDAPLPSTTPSKQHPPVSSLSRTLSAPVQATQGVAEDSNSDEELFVSQTQGPSQPEPGIQGVEDYTQSSQDHEPTSDFEMPNAVQNAFDRMRPRRVPPEMATITIGNKTVTTMVGSGVPRKRDIGDTTPSPARKRRIHTPSRPSIFGRIQGFAAPGSQMSVHDGEEEEHEPIEDDEEEIQDEETVSVSGRGEVEAEAEEEDIEGTQDAVEEETDDAESFAPSDDNASQPDERIHTEPEPPDAGMNDEEKKRREDAEVQRLIQEAEKATQANSATRANKLNKGVSHRDSTVHLETTLNGSFPRIQTQATQLSTTRSKRNIASSQVEPDEPSFSQVAPEERLSLTIFKDDFARMRILGQFNLGFILASRSKGHKDELFIIDQHASDEKINFERLQSTTTVQNQRLVHPKRLDLTAVEEEIVIENQVILEKNGFVVDVDDSGDEPIGRRCSLLSLPLSKEVTFDLKDLEELIAILSETSTSHNTNTSVDIPRPSRVRKMFAMRACRSSIMIGKTLTHRQMERVVKDMGAIDKPWNCPHGRPTMRHLAGLGHWVGWDEYEYGNDRAGAGEESLPGVLVDRYT